MSGMPDASVVDLHKYPIDDIESQQRQEVVEAVQADLKATGCAVVRQFFSTAGLHALQHEAAERVSDAYYSKNKACNVYLGDGNAERPADHPQNVFLERTNGFVPATSFGSETLAKRLYDWPPLKQFIADCLGKDELYVYEDPVSNMIVNVCRPGQQFNWHFDTNEFTITMLLNAADSGGLFEYVPNLRRPGDECYDEVKQVLNGDRSRVMQLDLNEGDLQLFLGRFSLHRVSRNTGKRDRLLLIMSFAEKPGMVGNKVRVKDLYGQTTAVHDEPRQRRVRADELLD